MMSSALSVDAPTAMAEAMTKAMVVVVVAAATKVVVAVVVAIDG